METDKAAPKKHEYQVFEKALRKVLSVPHSEVKARIEAEKKKAIKKRD